MAINFTENHVERIVAATKARVNASHELFEALKSNIVQSELPEEYESNLKNFCRKFEAAENEVTIAMRTVTNASEVLSEKLNKISQTEVSATVSEADGSGVKATVAHLV